MFGLQVNSSCERPCSASRCERGVNSPRGCASSHAEEVTVHVQYVCCPPMHGSVLRLAWSQFDRWVARPARHEPLALAPVRGGRRGARKPHVRVAVLGRRPPSSGGPSNSSSSSSGRFLGLQASGLAGLAFTHLECLPCSGRGGGGQLVCLDRETRHAHTHTDTRSLSLAAHTHHHLHHHEAPMIP